MNHFQKKTLKNFYHTTTLYVINLLLACSLMSITELKAQNTVLVNPTGDGGFEAATSTYPANNWTVVNGAQNRLFVGSTPVASAGTNCAFSGATASNWTGEGTSTVNHFYRDIVFPAGLPTITLTFKYKESVTDPTFDYLKIYLVATTVTPVAGTQQAAAGQIGVTAGYDNATAYTLVTITIPASNAGTTKRLIFSWRSDGVSPNAAVAIDEIKVEACGPPTVNAGPDQPSLGCANTATLAGNDPTPNTGLWTVVSGAATFTNPTLYNTGVTGLGGGATTLKWTVSSGACSANDNVVLTRSAVFANAGPDQGLCVTNATLAGNDPTAIPAAGTWTLISGAGNITSPSSFNTPVTGLGAGNNVFRWTVTDGTCSPSDDVTISSVTTDTWTGLGAPGNWADGANWDLGVPPSCANVVIAASANQPILAANTSIASLTVAPTATLTIASAATLTLSGNLTVNGTLDNIGKLTMSAATPTFTMGATGTYIHQPNLTPLAATSADMFVKATESFDTASTLIIKSWYNSTGSGTTVNVPLANNMQGNYGNLIIDPNIGTIIRSPNASGTVVRWFQNNLLLAKIKGNLSIFNSTIIIAPTPPNPGTGLTGAISLTVTGNIILNNPNSTLVGLFHFNNTPNTSSTCTVSITANQIIMSNGLFKGIENLNVIGADATGPLTITTTQGIAVTGGTFFGGLSGLAGAMTGSSITINSSITLTNTAIFYGVQDCTVPVTITAASINLANTSLLYGAYSNLLPANGIVTINNADITATGGTLVGAYGIGLGSVSNGNVVFSGLQSVALSGTAKLSGNYAESGGTATGDISFGASSINLSSGNPTFNLGGLNATGTFIGTVTGFGNLTVNAGTFNMKRETGNAAITVGGDCIISGGELDMFNPGSGTSTNTSTIGLNVNGNFTQSSGIFEFDKTTTNASGSRTLTVKGNFTHSGGTFRGVQETISTAVMNGSIAQTMTGASPTTFLNLTINNTAGVTMSGGAFSTVKNTLTLTNGLLIVDNSTLTLESATTIAGGTFSATKMIVTNGTGLVSRKFTANGTFLYPLGDNTGTVEYSPITLNFTSGTYAAGAYASAGVTDAKHPDNGSNTNYITRYWRTAVSGISAFACTVNGTYLDPDIAGTEAAIANGKWTGSLPWIKTGAVTAASNAVTFTGTTSLGDFTGISLAAPTVTIAGNSTRCSADTPTQLTAIPVGDTTFTYSWSPATGLSSTTISNPTANPPSTTAYIVTVTDANGFTATSPSFNLTVNPMPAANAGPDISICLGSSTTLLGSGNGTYAWSPSTGLSCTACANPVANPTDNTTYILTVVSSNCGTGVDSVTISITPSPSVNAGPDATICYGGNTQINSAGSGIFAWSPASGLSCTNCPNPIANPSITTTYTVTISDCGTASDSITITVNPLPPANAGADVTMCPGASTALSASGGIIYVWNPATGLDDANISNPMASPVVPTSYMVDVTDTNGCSASDEVMVSIYNSTPANAGSDAVVCIGDSVQLSASGGISYVWNPSAGLNNPNISNPLASPGATATFIVTVTDTNNCSASDSVIVTVNPLPAAYAGTDVNICNGSSTTLNATGGASYVWSPADGLSCTNCPSPVATPTANTTYAVTVTDTNGCSAGDSVMVTLTNSIVAYAGMDTAICSGASATLNASGGANYSWSTGDLTASIIVSPTTGTDYWVVVSSGNCAADTDSVFVIVSPALMDSVIIVPPICGNNDGSASVTVSGGVGFYTYLWSNGDTTSTVTGITGMPPDTLIVTITDANGCTITDTAIVGCVSGVSESPAGLSISIFPNPFSGEFTINNLRSKIYDLEIYNLMGEKVYSPAAPINKERVTLNLSDLPRGMYFVKLIPPDSYREAIGTESGTVTKKIIRK